MITTERNLNDISKEIKSKVISEHLIAPKLFESTEQSKSQNSFDMNILGSSPSKQSIKSKIAKKSNGKKKNNNEIDEQLKQATISNFLIKPNENIQQKDQFLSTFPIDDLEKQKTLEILLESNETILNSIPHKELKTKEVENQSEKRYKIDSQSNDNMYIKTVISLIIATKSRQKNHLQ